MEQNQRTKLYNMLPLVTFVVSYFIFHLFDWMEATQLLWAALVSILTYGAMVSEFKEEVKNPKQNARLNFYVGLLSLIFVFLIINAFIHWNRMIASDYRFSLLILLALIFFVVLFRAIRVLADFKALAETKNNQ